MIDWIDILLRGSAWLSLGAWAACEWLRSDQRHDAARAAFLAGLGALVLHSLIAFHVRYDWSHAAALADAARQIEAVTGRASSDGFVANYAFLGWWAVEGLAWWLWPERYRSRPAPLAWASRLWFGFMFVNGSIVFARGPVRAFGAAALAVAAWSWMRTSAPRHLARG
jgi:hypothetical protein